MIWIGIAIIIGAMIIGGCIQYVADAILGINYHDKDKDEKDKPVYKSKTKKNIKISK